MRTRTKLVSGMGTNDADYPVNPRKDGKIVCCPYYRAWTDMLRRCYNDSYKLKFPTYEGCSVCPEWLKFSNFKAWMETQDWEGKHLDKDLLVPGNKVYSPETCVFVSPQVNSFLLDNKSSSGALPTGLHLHKRNNAYIAQCRKLGGRGNTYIGSYNSVGEAEAAYKKFKSQLAVQLAAEQTDKRVSLRLLEIYKEVL